MRAVFSGHQSRTLRQHPTPCDHFLRPRPFSVHSSRLQNSPTLGETPMLPLQEPDLFTDHSRREMLTDSSEPHPCMSKQSFAKFATVHPAPREASLKVKNATSTADDIIIKHLPVRERCARRAIARKIAPQATRKACGASAVLDQSAATLRRIAPRLSRAAIHCAKSPATQLRRENLWVRPATSAQQSVAPDRDAGCALDANDDLSASTSFVHIKLGDCKNCRKHAAWSSVKT